MSCQHMMTLGVYLLGALDPKERSAFEAHLSFCEICRGELVRLAPLPGLLNQISPEDFADNLPPTGVEGMSGMTVVVRAQQLTEPVPLPRLPVEPPDIPALAPPRRPGRSRRFWRSLAAAAAVVILGIGAVFGWQALRHEEQPPQAAGVVWSTTAPDGASSVEARLVDHEWGTEIQSKIHGLPPGRKCYLFVYDHYGNREVAGWWGTDHDPNIEIPASTSIMRSKINRLVYMLDDKETVVFTVEAPR
jgi:hypothetical protein